MKERDKRDWKRKEKSELDSEKEKRNEQERTIICIICQNVLNIILTPENVMKMTTMWEISEEVRVFFTITKVKTTRMS